MAMKTKRISGLRSLTTKSSLEEKDKDVFGDEKFERPNRKLRLFSLSLKESAKESIFINEVESVGGKQSRQLSQLLSSMKEEESGFDNHHEVLVLDERKGIGRKLSHRFSSLFAGPSADSSGEESSLSGEGDESNTDQPRDITTMVFKFFHVRNPRQGSKHKRNISTRSAASFKPRQPDLKLRKAKKDKKALHIKLFWKRKPEPHATKITDNADTLSLTATVVKKSDKSRHRSTSVCDSKCSSVSFTSLPHELISITTSQCTILLRLLHKVARSIENQERLTANFSTNLAHLFARKERSIVSNKRMSKEIRKMLIGMMNGLRELVGKTFLKKAVFLQRSLQLTHDLEDMLVAPQREGGTLEVNDSETTLVGSPQLDTPQSMAVTISELNASAVSLQNPHQLDIHTFQHTLHTMREDIDVQVKLDQALRGGIVGPCQDVRFPATINERIAMTRFVAFLDGYLGHLERRYLQEGRVVGVLERLGGVLRDGNR
jgi:hypothetical protein